MTSQNFTAIDELIKKNNEMKYGTGSSNKEFDIPNPSLEVDELEETQEQKIEAQEVNEYMTPHPTTIKLPPNLKKLGLETEENTQFKEVLNRIKFPISDEKIMENLQASPSEAKRWYATILLYMLEQAHITIKKVGSKVVRIFKTS